jgi:glycosyltransferase involved in cell wall biosynthesis
MRIAQVAPLYESVPPKLYGGTERVVSYLTEELVRQGHDVTLFASGDSVTRARLHAVTEQSLRLDRDCIDPLSCHLCEIEDVFQAARSFDVIHFHIGCMHHSLFSRQRTPYLTTLHGRLDIPELQHLHHRFPHAPLVAISEAQKRPLHGANWIAVVQHGLPPDLYRFHPGPGRYLAFVGRISPEKRVDRAIEIAERAGVPLKIAAKVDNADRKYFHQKIEPLLAGSRNVEFIGEIGEKDKDHFLGNAAALLFPIDWPEPFGLVMIEAMATGTPVIAWRRGSVPEVIDRGVTGFIVDGIGDAVRAVRAVDAIDRRRCRQRFLERFPVARMARDYIDVYERLGLRPGAREIQTA